MALTDFTSYDEIRATLGVTTKELTDATLSLDLYEFGLIATLDGVDPLLRSTYSTVMAIGSDTRSSQQTRLYQSVRIFSSYAVAKQLTTSLPLFAPKDVTDGKAAVGRFSTDPYKETTKAIKAAYDEYLGILLIALGALTVVTAVVTPRVYMSISSPSRDPVLGT